MGASLETYVDGVRTLSWFETNRPTYWSSNVSADPKFVNEVADPNFSDSDLHLKSTSPMINAGAFLTQTTSSGSGTTLTVDDARYFMDGWGIIEGDTIQLEGQTKTATITNISGNTITLNTSLTWNNNQGVSLAYSGTAPDIGAYEYGGSALPPPTYQCSDNIDNDGDGLTDMNDPGCSGATDNDEFNAPQSTTCSTFTYSNWSPTTCPVNQTQTRTVASQSPSGCTGGTSVLTQSCTYTPPTTPSSSPFSQYYEAETMNLTSPMIVGNDTNASGNQYISPTTGSNSSNPQQEATLSFTLSTADTYYLWAKIYGPDLSSDAMYVGIDNIWDRIYPSVINTYEWIKVETEHNTGNFQFNLTQGNHTLQVGHGEINARLDTLFITNDPNEIPTTPTLPLPPILGDLDGNGTVNSLDWSIMNSAWGTSNTQADLNNDGIVNTIDFSILNSSWSS